MLYYMLILQDYRYTTFCYIWVKHKNAHKSSNNEYQRIDTIVRQFQFSYSKHGFIPSSPSQNIKTPKLIFNRWLASALEKGRKNEWWKKGRHPAQWLLVSMRMTISTRTGCHWQAWAEETGKNWSSRSFAI